MTDAEVIRNVLDENVKEYVMEDKEHRAAVIGIHDGNSLKWTAIGQAGFIMRTLVKGIAEMLVKNKKALGNPMKVAMTLAVEIVKETRKAVKERS